MRRWGVIVLSVWLFGAATNDYLNVKKKFSAIDQGKVKAGSHVTIPEKELQAYVQTELPTVAPPGVSNPRVELESGIATGKATIDFLKLRAAAGAPRPNWLLRTVLEGEHEVEVSTRVSSSNGQARVDVDRVEIAGIPISGGALDYLIRNYLLPRYPRAKIGKPFELGYGIDRLDLRPNEVRIIMR